MNHLLSNAEGLRVAVLVNYFGSVNIDVGLVRRHDGETIDLANGCLCCTLVHGFAAAVGRIRDRVSGKLGDLWWAFMVRGIFAGVLGLIALIWPIASLTLLIRLVGIYILVEGVVSLLGAWRASEKGLGLWRALASVVIGLVLLIWPEPFIRILLMIFGAWALYTGITQILEARRMDPQVTDRGLLTTIGILVAVIGLVLLLWPQSGLVTIAWVIALAALLVAGLFIFLALRLKNLKARVGGMGAAR